MYKEGDHIRIMVKNTAYIMHQTVIIFMSLSGLTAAAGISVRVVYLDRGSGDQAVHHDFPEDSPPDIVISTTASFTDQDTTTSSNVYRNPKQ